MKAVLISLLLLSGSGNLRTERSIDQTERSIDAPVVFDFSQQEIDRLERGEAITDYMRYVDDHGDQAGFAASSLLVRRPAKEVWGILLDLERHHEFFPGILLARIVQRDGDKQKVHFHTETYVLEPEFTVDMILDHEKMRMSYTLDKTSPVDFYNQMDGFWQVTPWAEGVSLATYRLAAGVDFPIPNFVLNPIIETLVVSSLPKVMKALDDRAKSLAARKTK